MDCFIRMFNELLEYFYSMLEGLSRTKEIIFEKEETGWESC